MQFTAEQEPVSTRSHCGCCCCSLNLKDSPECDYCAKLVHHKLLKSPGVKRQQGFHACRMFCTLQTSLITKWEEKQINLNTAAPCCLQSDTIALSRTYLNVFAVWIQSLVKMWNPFSKRMYCFKFWM